MSTYYLSPADLLEWQIIFYSKRIKETVDPKAKNWLKNQLRNLTKNPNDEPSLPLFYLCSRNIKRTTNNGISKNFNQL